MGRTEEQNAGFLAFNNHRSSTSSSGYWRFRDTASADSVTGWKLEMAKRFFSLMRDQLRTIVDNLIYRHIG